MKGDLLDLLDLLGLQEPAGDTEARDSQEDCRVGKYERCPDCNQTAWGSCYPPPHQRHQYRLVGGWLTLGSCRCGRYRWRSIERRSGDYWLNDSPDIWGSFVPEPDIDAWMSGGPR